MALKLVKHENHLFGQLTSIQNPSTGRRMFISSEVGRIFGHTNMKQSVVRLLSSDESMVVTQKKFPQFISILRDSSLINNKTNRVQLISESGLWKLALHSNLPNGKAILDWVSREVIPSITQTGGYSISQKPMNSGVEDLSKHTLVPFQKENSKAINAANYASGVPAIIDYNRKNCLVHSGMTTQEVKELGKKNNLKSHQRSSAKEVLRHIKPEVACAMSLADRWAANGNVNFDQISEITKNHAIPLFKSMIEYGLVPIEMNDNNKLED